MSALPSIPRRVDLGAVTVLVGHVLDVLDAVPDARTVWKIPAAPFKGAHFATFPPELARRCILAGTSERGACAACGAAWARVLERVGNPERNWREFDTPSELYGAHGRRRSQGHAPNVGAAVVRCTVLDPFGGSGTTGAVAKTHGRVAVLCEAQPEYLPLIARRIAEAPGYQPALGGLR